MGRSLFRRRPDGFTANAKPLTMTVFGVEPIGAFQQSSIDEQCGLGMTERSGTVRIGNSGSPFVGYRYAGDCGPLQDFRGGAFVGKSASNIRYRPNIGLPSTSGPSPAMSPVTSLLADIAENRVN
jgi:hypothetical protein